MIFSVKRRGKTVVIYEPQPHQILFHAATAPNVIMEGGAGSGKSIAIRMDAYMRAFTTPGFKALILRRSFPELQLSHLQHVDFEREKLGLPKDAWHKTEYTLRIKHPAHPQTGEPQPDSIVVFGHAENDDTVSKYLSSEWEMIAFDELCTFTLRQFSFLSSRARTTIPGLRPIIRGGTNPIGLGAAWVRRFFITKKPKKSEAPMYRAEDWVALKSTVRDNRYVDQTEYLTRLQALPSEALRKAMDTGEWVIEGQFFSEWAESKDLGKGLIPWHRLGALPRIRGQRLFQVKWVKIVRVVDWGYSEDGNPGVCAWFAIVGRWAVCFKEYYFKQTLPKDVALEILKRSQGMRVTMTVGDPAMWREHVGPSIAETFAEHGVSMVEADNERVAGWVQVHVNLKTVLDNGDEVGPHPQLQFYVPESDLDEDGCGVPTIARTMPDMVIAKTNANDLETRGVEDDGPDVVRYFAMSRAGTSKESPKPEIPPHLREIYDFCARKRRQERRRR